MRNGKPSGKQSSRPQGKPQGKPQFGGNSRRDKPHHGKPPHDRGVRPQQGRPDDKPRDRPPAKVAAPTTFTVEGMAALSEYLRFKPETVMEVAAAPQMKRDVETRLSRSGVTINVRELPKPQPGDDRTSPVTARVKVKTLEWHEMLERMDAREPRAPEIVLALDHITDPRNLGAIVRSAAFFGITEVIVPERRQVLLTQASVGTAQGGFALADLVCVVNLGRAIDELKERGFWAIGADMNGEPFHKLTREYQKVILVLGAEDTGISDGVRKKCDRIASIPGRDPGLESLNVSVAAGVLLAAFASLS